MSWVSRAFAGRGVEAVRFPPTFAPRRELGVAFMLVRRDACPGCGAHLSVSVRVPPEHLQGRTAGWLRASLLVRVELALRLLEARLGRGHGCADLRRPREQARWVSPGDAV